MCSQWPNPHLSETSSLTCEQTTSVIDLTISTPGLALRCVWEVLPDTNGSDHYPILTSVLPSVAEKQPSCDPSHWVFSKADWENIHDLCLEGITEDIQEKVYPLHFCQTQNKGCKWQHPKGNHHSQELKPLVWLRMLGSPESKSSIGQQSQTKSRIQGGNPICLQKFTGAGSSTLHPEEMSVMGRVCLKAVIWYSH